MSPKISVSGDYSQEDVEKALGLLEQNKRAKAKEEAKKNDPAYREKLKEQGRRAGARQAIMLQKARDAGITVSQNEIEAYVASKK